LLPNCFQAKEADGDLSHADLELLLSPDDLRAFQRQLASGRLGHLVQPWSPWWLGEEAQVIIQNVAQLMSLVVVQQPWSSWWLCQESGGTSDK